MRPFGPNTSRNSDARRSSAGIDTAGDTQRAEELLIRSYDHQWAYDVDVEITKSGGEVVYERRYYLLPGHSESETNIVPNGEYTISVTVDNSREREIQCQLDGSLEHTAVIEVGNGAFSLTAGLYAP